MIEDISEFKGEAGFLGTGKGMLRDQPRIMFDKKEVLVPPLIFSVNLLHSPNHSRASLPGRLACISALSFQHKIYRSPQEHTNC